MVERAALLALALLAFPVAGQAQDAGAPAPAVEDETESRWLIELPPRAELPLVSHNLPAGTAVSLVIDAELSSNSSMKGETFAISLAEPLVIDGAEVLPAGTPGIGEVLAAEGNRGRGRAGRLAITVCHLNHESRLIPLAAPGLAPDATSRKGAATAVGLAGIALPLPIGLAGRLIKGDRAVIPAGTVIEAAIAEDTLVVREIVPEHPEKEAPPREAQRGQVETSQGEALGSQ